jgi:hypothetical protein
MMAEPHLCRYISSMMFGALIFAVFLISTAGSAQADGIHVYKRYDRKVLICRTGWWRVRDGADNNRPSDGIFRPSWHQRCRVVRAR